MNNIQTLNMLTAFNSAEYTRTLDRKFSHFCHYNDQIRNDIIVAQESDQFCTNLSKREYFAILLCFVGGGGGYFS